jgi:hypothetical protein
MKTSSNRVHQKYFKETVILNQASTRSKEKIKNIKIYNENFIKIEK